MRIIADTHTHTIASDHAYSTVTENCTAAAEAGLKCIAITDHYGLMPDSPHDWHFYAIGNLPRKLNGVYLLRGAEVNIVDFEGSIDLTERWLINTLDWIIASIHEPVYALDTFEEITRAYIGTASNPAVDCIGHPEVEGSSFDYEKVICALKEHGTLLEINNSRLSRKGVTLQRYAEMLKVCKKHEVSVIVNSDAHFHEQVGRLDLATQLIESVGFPERLVLNADWDRFAEYVSAKRPHIFD